MTFQGGDTSTMRRHSALLTSDGDRLAALVLEAGDIARTVEWVGPDAEALRERCDVAVG